MKKKNKDSAKVEKAACLCQGTGPALSELLHRIGPPEQARRHFDAARVEFLKGLRALIDARIERVSKANARGAKIDVE
jgi:hypothetical protein